MKLSGKSLAITLSCLLFASFFTGCSKEMSPKTDSPENGVALTSGDTVAMMDIDGYGTIKIKLFPDIAPKAVENFTTHAKDGYYDGLTFHRVISDFMIQGGDPSGTGAGGSSIWGTPFEDEFSDSARNFTGALSMANAGPATNGSQFFIVNSAEIPADQLDAYAQGNGIEYSEEDIAAYTTRGGTPHLDNVHTVFGMVYSGMGVVDKIMADEVDANAKPVKTVKINKVVIAEY